MPTQALFWRMMESSQPDAAKAECQKTPSRDFAPCARGFAFSRSPFSTLPMRELSGLALKGFAAPKDSARFTLINRQWRKLAAGWQWSAGTA
jgi:hypothetical protein